MRGEESFYCLCFSSHGKVCTDLKHFNTLLPSINFEISRKQSSFVRKAIFQKGNVSLANLLIIWLEFKGNETHRLANKALVNVVLNLYIFSIRPHLSRRQTVLEAMAAHFLNQNRVCLGFSISITIIFF